MEQKYTFYRKLTRNGNSVGVTIPKLWFRMMNNYRVKVLKLELGRKQLVITPTGKRKCN